MIGDRDFNSRSLETVIREFTAQLQVFLRERDKVASGVLYNSLRTTVEIDGSVFSILLHSEDYLKYVDEGRKPGKFPPINKIRQWIKIKPVMPYPDKSGRLPDENSLAFLISRSIAKNGIEPTHIIDKVMDSYRLEDKVTLAIFSEIEKLVDDLIDKKIINI